MIKDKEPSNDVEKKEAMPTLEVVARGILVKKIRKLFDDPSAAIVILFSGDRLSCCDEGVIMQSGESLIGVATIAPEGEGRTGQPTIVALYITPEFRGKGYGSQILRKAIERCVERGFNKIRMDVMSSSAKKIIDKLPIELQERIDVHDLGNIMDNF